MITIKFKSRVVDGAVAIPTWKRSHVCEYDSRIGGFINSNLVGPVVNREVVRSFGESLKCGKRIDVANLPAGVTITGDFMKEVTIRF